MLILAPMQGLTELMFRKVYHRCFPGALDYAISPFLSLTHGNLTEAWEKIDDVLPEPNRDSIPVIPQILGKEPVEFIDLANRLFDIGYTEINWNIGCPMRRVTAKHRGSGILPYPDEVDRILGQVIPHLKPRLSVKMRLGLKSPDEIFNLIPVLNNYPLLNVTIHPRTGRQQYTGQVDLDTFSRALPLLHHKVIYNGDICTPADYRRISQRFPSIQEFMIGRGILYEPLLPLKIKKGQPDNPAATLHFVQELLNAIQELPIREESRMRKTKEYWCLVRRSLPITEQQATAVLRAQTPSETNTKLRAILASI